MIKNIKKSGLQAKKILFIHSETFLRPPYAKTYKLINYLSEYDLLLTNSQFMFCQLSKEYPQIAHKIKVVRLGVDLERFASIHEDHIRQVRIENREKHE